MRRPGGGSQEVASFPTRRRQSVADEALIRTLFEEHGGALLAYATRLLGDRQAAEDVVQETLVRAWRHPDALVNGKGSVRGWLLTVARNLVIDRVRARAARPPEVADAAAMPLTVQDHADSVADSMVVMEALDQLSREHRDVLVEIYFKGSSVSEAAATLGIPPGTVRSRSYYALRSLRTWVRSRGALEGVSR
jgi:RNA polymerase sigma-70 factor, ECF subfamily